MEPVVKDAEDGEEQTDTDQDQHTDTDRTEGEDSVTTPSQSRSPSVHAQEADMDVFDGYSFKGRHSVVIDDDENSDLGDEDNEYEEDEEDASISKSPVSEDVGDQESALADTEDQAVETETEEEREAEPRTPEARPTTLPAEVPTEETKPTTEPAQPAETTEPSAPTKRPSVEIPRPSVDSQRSEISSKSGNHPSHPSLLTSLGHRNTPASGERSLASRHLINISETASTSLRSAKKRMSGISSKPAWMKSETDQKEQAFSLVVSSTGTSWPSSGKSTPSRHGNRTSKTSGTEAVSPSPSEKQSRGRTPLSFRNKKKN
jgi:serum/glucocorticoid-regulated kinase 2